MHALQQRQHAGDHARYFKMLTIKKCTTVTDRVSKMDDRKGLGYDDGLMQDAVPVTSQLSVSFEKRDSEAASDEQKIHPHHIYHSTVAHYHHDRLLRPPLVMQWLSAIAEGKVHEAQILSLLDTRLPGFPCDYEITSLRPVSVAKRDSINARQCFADQRH